MRAPTISLTEEQRSALRELAESPRATTRVATRAQIVLALAQHWRTRDVAEALGVSVPTVALWRRRFLDSGIEGLADRHEQQTNDGELLRLLDAAERTVSKRGFCATRVADIALEAGVSSSLLMYYFDSRQETLVRAMLHAHQRAATRYEEQPDVGRQTVSARLSTFIARVLPDAGSQLDEYLLELDLLAHARQYPEFVSIWDEHQRNWVAGLSRIISDGVADGSFADPGTDLDELALTVLALVDGFGYQLAVGASTVTREMMSRAVAGYLASRLGLASEVLIPR